MMSTPTEPDVLILGSGAAGLAAALAAHEAGAGVRLFERADRVGGTSAVSGGVIWVPCNPRMAEAGIADSRAAARAYFRALSHGDIRDDVLDAFIDKGPEALAFLESIDALRVALLPGYPDYYLDRPGALPGGGRALDHDLFALGELGEWADRILAIEDVKPLMLRETPLGGGDGRIDLHAMQRRIAARERGFGQAMVGRLLKPCLVRGIVPETGVTTRRLWIEAGRVRGVVIATDAGEAVVPCGAVVIATGGFEWNAALRQAFLRGPAPMPASPPVAQGEGLALAMAAGARLANMTSAWWAPTLAPDGHRWADGSQRANPLLIERTVPHGLMVNRAGQRFCNEAANYSALAGAFHAFDPQSYSYPNQPAWLVFDAQFRARYPLDTVMPGDPLPGWIMTAPSLAALAQQLGIDPAALAATVERFNGFARAGEDRDFQRGTRAYDHFYGDRSRSGAAVTLGTVEQPPFFAVPVHMGMLGTNGGPETDAQARILGHDGAPIPGLFGAGNAIACPTGGVYAGAGGTLGPALTFGYIAGQNAARRDNLPAA